MAQPPTTVATTVGPMRVVAAVDKFRGSASAAQIAGAIGHACWEIGLDCDEFAMADGGEGTLDALGGPNRTTKVTGPLGAPVDAEWRFHRGTAVIESARASGLDLIGGAEHNSPLDATTAGTGELIRAAVTLGAQRIIVALGGSATTDGGLGAIDAIAHPARLRGVEVVVAADVRTHFVDAARVFGPQKGATEAQVRLLTRRLEGLADRYQTEFGVDVRTVDGAGAAGGLAGGLAALGARIVPGFELVADELDLFDALEGAHLVITGEGRLDQQSFDGKVVGGVADLASEYGVACGAIVGSASPDSADRITHVDLTTEFGDLAWTEPLKCVERATKLLVDRMLPGRP